MNIAGWTVHNNALRKSIFLNVDCDVYSISETHLSDNGDFSPDVNGYQFIPHNRQTTHRLAPGTWGGVGFLIKQTVLDDYEMNIIDKTYDGILAIELVHREKQIKLLLITTYLPPENSPYGRDCSSFYNHLEQLCYSYSNEYDLMFFCGDVNGRVGKLDDYVPDVDIELPKRVVIDEIENNHGKAFINFLTECKMCILNGRFDPSKDNFTYIGRGKSVVDYFYCPHDLLQSCSDFEVMLSTEIANRYQLTQLIHARSKLPDHSMLRTTLHLDRYIHTEIPPSNENIPDVNERTQMPSNPYNVRNVPENFFSDADACNKLLDLINALELSIENQATVDKYYQELILCIFCEMEKCLPKCHGNGTKSSKRFKIKKPYWNDHLKQLWTSMCEKESAFVKYRGPNHVRQYLKEQFKDSSKTFHRALKRAEREYNKKVQDDIENVCTTNPKKFWNYIKRLGPKNNNRIPQEVYDDNGNVCYDFDSVLQKWKTEYEKLYKPESDQFDNNFYEQILHLLHIAEDRMSDPLYQDNHELNRNITLKEVENIVDKSKNNKATGIDLIPNEVLRSNAVKSCLQNFFQYYLDTGILPSCWGKAIIKPIPKSKSKDPRVPLNYRGINLLSNIYKVYNSVINKRIISYLEKNNLLDDSQNGFREKRSCLEHIYLLYSIIQNRKNMSKDTFVAYIDFMKCFDLIDRNLLFYKLTEYGIDGKLYRTLKMMYTNTMSAVNINNSLSDWFYTENGCRQGDVTSPTAFSILINDLLKELKASNIGIPVENLVIPVLAFADDIALLAENESDLQKLINIVHKWSCKWRFIINPEKKSNSAL